MEIKIIETEKEFLSLKNSWDRLTYNHSNSHKWLYSWWKYNNENKRLKMLLAKDKGEIIGIAPICLDMTKVYGLIPFKKLCFLGGRVSDNLDFFIVDDSRRETVFKAFLNFIEKNINYDQVEFNQINSCSPYFELWQKYAEIPGLKFGKSMENHKINFSGYQTFDDYYNQLGKKTRRNLQNKINILNKDNQNVDYIFKSDITEEDFQLMAKINIKRQKYLYEKGDINRYCYFTIDGIKNLFKEYFLSDVPGLLAYMVCNGKIISYYLSALNKDTFSALNAAFDQDYEKYSPSKLLVREIIRYAFENNLKYFDFMRGSENYKHEWANEMSINYNLVRRKSLKAKLLCFVNEKTPNLVKKLIRISETKKIFNNKEYKPEN